MDVPQSVNHLLIEGQLGCPSMNKASMNIHVQIFVLTGVF